MTEKKTSRPAAAKTGQTKTAPKTSATSARATGKTAAKTTPKSAAKPKVAAAAKPKAPKVSKDKLGGASGTAPFRGSGVKATGKLSSSGGRKRSRKKSSLRNKPLIMALLTVLLLGGGGVYWLFGHGFSGQEAEVSEVARKPEVPLPQLMPKAALKPQPKSVQAKPVQANPIVPVNSDVSPKPENAQPSSRVAVAPSSISPAVSVAKPKLDLAKPGELEPGTSVSSGRGFEASGQDYETSFGTILEQSSKDIDAALVDLLKNKGFSSKNIKILEVERRSRATDAYYFQKLRLELPDTSYYSQNPALFGQEFAATLPALLVGAELASPSPRHYVISVNGLVTHEILLMFYHPDQVLPTLTPPPGEALLAIVIDDVGANLSAAKTLVDLDYPVTLAIWPRSGYAAQCAQLGHAKGLEIMIHQPMEPVEYPKNKPGPGAVFNHMNRAEIMQVVAENIPLVPYAVGLNNHMGSRFTQNKDGLDAVLSAMKGKKLFVLDSVTHGGSFFYSLARERGFAAQRRDIFLDVTHDKNAILYQLRKSERLAHSQGYAIAIGHPLPATLEALKEWQSSRDKSVKLVRVEDLIKYKRPSGD